MSDPKHELMSLTIPTFRGVPYPSGRAYVVVQLGEGAKRQSHEEATRGPQVLHLRMNSSLSFDRIRGRFWPGKQGRRTQYQVSTTRFGLEVIVAKVHDESW